MIESSLDGGAARLLATGGVRALRAHRPSNVIEPPKDVDSLHLVSLDAHRRVPRTSYYKAAKSLRTQASVTLGQIRLLETETPTPDVKRRIESLRRNYRGQLEAAETARKLGYARRSTMHDLLARMIPADYRPHAHVVITVVGLAINLLWFAYLAKVYAEKKASHGRAAAAE